MGEKANTDAGTGSDDPTWGTAGSKFAGEPQRAKLEGAQQRQYDRYRTMGDTPDAAGYNAHDINPDGTDAS
jgi:hypothetical protein